MAEENTTPEDSSNKKHTIKDLSKFKPKGIKKEGKNITVSLSTTNVIIGVLALALVASIFSGGFGFGGSDSTGNTVAVQQPTAAPQPSQPAAPAPAERIFVSTDDDPVLGDEDAPVTIIEFSDYECPFCGRFWSQTLPSIKSEYVETGKAKLVYRDLPLSFHPNAQKAGEAAECAGDQGMYWEMHDVLFENGVAGGVASFKQYAADLGLDSAEFDSCLDDGVHADEVSQDASDANAAGATGTPSFFIGNDDDGYVKVVGAQPFATFQAAIDAELA